MPRRFLGLSMVMALALSTLTVCAQEPAKSAQQKKAPEPLTIKVGDMAPDFTLLAYDGTKVAPVSLHDFKGKKKVALAFFVFAFTGG